MCLATMCLHCSHLDYLYSLLCIYKTNETFSQILGGKGLINVILYLDDVNMSVKGDDRAISTSTQVMTDLENAGFIINAEKSIWAPSQAIE